MVYDCFMFFNELDLLEIRLAELYPLVDYFVLCESPITHSGQEKPLYFKDNMHRYLKYLNKIVHRVVPEETMLAMNSSWGRENFQRDYCAAEITFKYDDIIISSDCDEIPSAKSLVEFEAETRKIYNTTIKTAHMTCYYGRLTNKIILPRDHQPWRGSTFVRVRDEVNGVSLSGLRAAKDSFPPIVCGWHFSYLGGVEAMKYKITSFAHTEYDKEEILNSLDKSYNNRKDPLGRPEFIIDQVDIDCSYPREIYSNLYKYEHLL